MNELILYTTEDGRSQIKLRAQEQAVWLTQLEMAELFTTSKQNIGQHLMSIFEEGELGETSVVKQHLTTAADSKNYATKNYNLDVIISVGYRVSHPRWRLKNDSHARFAQDAKTRRFKDHEEKPLSRFLPLRLSVFA